MFRLFILAICLIAISLLSYRIGNRDGYSTAREESINERKEFIRTKQGWTSFFGGKEGLQYYLVSFDKEKTWYVLDKNNKIKGDVKTVYPGLIEHINGFERLTKYVEKNGPIGKNGIISSEEIEILKESGITVTK